MSRAAVYGLSADPPTNGHLRVIQYGAEHYDELHVVVASNPDKRYAFTEPRRLQMLNEIVDDHNLKNVKVVLLPPRQLLVRYAVQIGATTLLRGIRNNTDHDYEAMMAHFNEWMEPKVRTLYVGPHPGQPFVSSSFVKALVGMEDWNAYVPALVPESVMHYLRQLEKRKNGDA